MTEQPHYPYRSGDVAVLGPEVFASADGQTITWQGANYRRDHGPDAPTGAASASVSAPQATDGATEGQDGERAADRRERLREQIAQPLATLTVVGGVPPQRLVPVIDWADNRPARIAAWQTLDSLIDDLLAVVQPHLDPERRDRLDAALAALGKSEIELADVRATLARVRAIGPYQKPIHGDRGQGMQMGWDAALQAVHAALDQPPAATESSPDVDPVYDPKAWETYRRNAGCGCTAPAPVDCKIPHGTGAWLCVCHRLAGPPATEPGKPQSREDASIRQFFQEPNRCTSTAGMFRCARPTGHPGGHRAGRIFWGRRADDQPAHNAGPSIAECAANDRRWPLEKNGE